MRIMFASDIHGSEYYCKKMLEAYRDEKAGKLVLLGDILYHGPRNDLPKGYAPKQVIAQLNDIREEILCVRGNCDTEVDQMVLAFPIMADYMALFLDGLVVYATHGHKYNRENPPCLAGQDILLCGHTHVPADEQTGTFRYLNPGSVSIPKENSGHGYIIYEDRQFLFKEL